MHTHLVTIDASFYVVAFVTIVFHIQLHPFDISFRFFRLRIGLYTIYIAYIGVFTILHVSSNTTLMLNARCFNDLYIFFTITSADQCNFMSKIILHKHNG